MATALGTLHQRVANVGAIGTRAIEQKPVADEPARAGADARRRDGPPRAVGGESDAHLSLAFVLGGGDLVRRSLPVAGEPRRVGPLRLQLRRVDALRACGERQT